MVEIRELQEGQPDALVELFEAVLPDFEASLSGDGAGPQAFLEDPASLVLGAYAGGTPTGLAWGLQMRSPSGRLTTYVHELEVREAWRRQGIATALITEAMALARRNGSTKFWLSTGAHNETAQALYETPRRRPETLRRCQLLVDPRLSCAPKRRLEDAHHHRLDCTISEHGTGVLGVGGARAPRCPSPGR